MSNLIYHICYSQAPFAFPQNKSAHSVQPFCQIYNKRNFSWKRVSFREKKANDGGTKWIVQRNEKTTDF